MTQSTSLRTVLNKAAEGTLDNLCESYKELESVLHLIRNWYNDYIEMIISKTKILEDDSKKNVVKIQNYENEIILHKSKIEQINEEKTRMDEALKELNKNIDNKNKEIELLKSKNIETDNNQQNIFKALPEIKDLLAENEDLKSFARELRNELEYGKQRENKLMYFLFLLQQKDYPVFDVFEEYIKDLNTQRFSTELGNN